MRSLIGCQRLVLVILKVVPQVPEENLLVHSFSYLLVSGLSLIWMVLSSWMLPCRPTDMLELGTLKVFLFLRVQQEVRP